MNTTQGIFARTALLLCCFALTPNADGQMGALPDVGLDRAPESDLAAPAVEDAVPDGLSGGEWSSIRAADEAGCHAARPTEDGYQARNPGQRWLTRFDGRGFTTLPDGGGWRWGLELESYGFASNERVVTEPTLISAERGRR